MSLLRSFPISCTLCSDVAPQCYLSTATRFWGVKDWYQSRDAPPSPNHITDFPANKLVLELDDPVMEVEEDPMEDSDMDIDVNEEDEWEEDDDLLMAPVIPPRATSFQLSSYEVGGASLAVPEAPYHVGHPLSVVAARVTLHHEEIGALCGNLVAGKLDETETHVLEMRDIVNNYHCGHVDLLREDVDRRNGWTKTMNQTMPPRRLIRSAVERLIADRVAKAIVEHERNRPNPIITGGVVTPNVHGCTYKTFMNGKTHPFSGTAGVVGLRRWFEKVKQVFEISKCAEEDKVKFAACTFKGRAMNWWNRNVHNLGLVNANSIPWNEFKATQRIEHELWTLTLKGGDIEGYNNRFHKLALMCLELVTLEKKIECYIRGLPKRIKANVTSSKPANLHDVINMARELVEQAIQAKSTRIGESNKRRWEEHQGTNNNRNHNIHHQ
ncbi:hypothetical protein Tco_1304439 [Tanacetum coccineum]